MKKIFNFISSIKFAGIVFLLIILLSFIGSFIPQGNHEFLFNKLEDNFGQYGHSIYNFLAAIGFIDIYSSPVFIVLLSLFSLSLIICTIKLIPYIRSGFKDIKDITALDKEMTSEKEKDTFLSSLKSKGWKITQQNQSIYKATKHSFARLGVASLHTGILIVLFGGLIGYFIGVKGFMNILEGDSDDVAVLPSGELYPLGFSIVCDKFTPTYYDNSSRPKSYESELTIYENGKNILSKTIDVNKPLKYNGFTFYQNSFGVYPNKNAKPIINIITDNKTRQETIKFNEPFKIKDNLVGRITDFAPTLAVDENGTIYSSSNDMNNPAILIEVYDIDKPALRAWVMSKIPESGNFISLGFKIEFKDMFGLRYTGLSVKKDAGTVFVYIGFIMMSLALLLIYLFNYTVIYFTIDGHRVKYKIRSERKYPLVDPEKSFYSESIK